MSAVDMNADATEAARVLDSAGRAGRAPVTILSGFLGSGKTTLLNYVLETAPHKRIAVIENEFGEEIGIENLIVDAQSGEVFEELFELGNGCICCSMRGELQRVLESILERDTKFDHIVVETTGLANPGPVAAEFWVDDDELESKYYLDAIVTVCDAKHVLQHLDDAQRDSRDVNEAERQLAFADRIVLNKCDLVDEKQLDEIEKRIRAINSQSPVIRTVRSRVALDQIIGINAFSPKRAAELLAQPESEGAHSTGVTTVSFVEPRPLHSIDAFKQWFASLLWETDERASDLFRIKGVLSVKDSNTRHVLQAVHETFDIGASGEWGDDEERLTRMVFIGRKLDRAKIKQSFQKHAVLGEPVEIEDET